MKHVCEGNLPNDDHGPAITDFSEDDTGKLWVSNAIMTKAAD